MTGNWEPHGPHLVKTCTGHSALLLTLTKGGDSHGEIAPGGYTDSLRYDMEVHYRPGKSRLMGIAGGTSKLLCNLQDEVSWEDIKGVSCRGVIIKGK